MGASRGRNRRNLRTAEGLTSRRGDIRVEKMDRPAAHLDIWVRAGGGHSCPRWQRGGSTRANERSQFFPRLVREKRRLVAKVRTSLHQYRIVGRRITKRLVRSPPRATRCRAIPPSPRLGVLAFFSQRLGVGPRACSVAWLAPAQFDLTRQHRRDGSPAGRAEMIAVECSRGRYHDLRLRRDSCSACPRAGHSRSSAHLQNESSRGGDVR
jgi:hypothetical protein